MTENPPVCTGLPHEPHDRTEMYEITTVGALQPEDWTSYHCSTCQNEIHIPSSN